MHKMDIRKFDLNTLAALDVLLREKHITRAAQIVGISQPAMSRTLAKLRQQLDDELLVRTDTGLALTPRAESLVTPLQKILGDIGAFIDPPKFDPQLLNGAIDIATVDMEMTLILPKLVAQVKKQAPGLNLRILDFIGGDFSVLDNAQADFVISALGSAGIRYHRRLLFSDPHVVVLNKRLWKSLGQTLTLKNFTEMEHGLVSIEGHGEGHVDRSLGRLGLQRRVSLHIPHFFLVPKICMASDLIFTVPGKIAKTFRQEKGIVVTRPPLDLNDANFYTYWHSRNHKNPLHVWFRKMIFDASQTSNSQG